MKFAVSKSENELSELTARLFDIKGRGAAATAKSAEAALLKANPHITDIRKIPEGTLIMIPELPDNPPVRAAQTAGIEPTLSQHLKSALKELADAIDRSAASEEQAAAAANEALKSRELKDFAAQLPELKAQIDKISNAAKDQLKEVKAEAAAQKEALSQLQAALGKLNL
jgi:DNA repair exonuclease SbcCD ATPase subunit